MPFTLSHPALVLPFNYLPRKYVSMTGLIIGSMMPDFESFIWMKADKTHSHTWLGILWFSLPVGLLLCFVYHWVVKDMFISHLPRTLQLKFIKYKNLNWSKKFREGWLVVVLCIIAGAATHLFWDAFSHFDGFFINSFPSLKGNIQIGSTELETPYLIQYLNSLIGLAIIALVVWKRPEARGVRIRIVISKFWVVTGAIAFGIYVLRMSFTDKYRLDDAIITAMSASFIGLIITSVIFKQGKVKDAWEKKNLA